MENGVQRRAFSQQEVCAMLGIHIDTLKEWRKDGKIRAVKIGRRVLVPAGEVDRILDEAS